MQDQNESPVPIHDTAESPPAEEPSSKISRRHFLKLSGGGAVGTVILTAGVHAKAAALPPDAEVFSGSVSLQLKVNGQRRSVLRPAWFADPLLAKVMILVVNTWLGYPYIMLLCSGLLKAIPADLYEASAIAGAGPLTNFLRITAPLIARPLTPLLISAFAFNFNNFVLISLLTDGRPDFLNTKLPAGTTDILVSYTYRIAFTDAGANFGLAAAISTLIFVIVALMSVINLRLTRAQADNRS